MKKASKVSEGIAARMPAIAPVLLLSAGRGLCCSRLLACCFLLCLLCPLRAFGGVCHSRLPHEPSKLPQCCEEGGVVCVWDAALAALVRHHGRDGGEVGVGDGGEEVVLHLHSVRSMQQDSMRWEAWEGGRGEDDGGCVEGFGRGFCGRSCSAQVASHAPLSAVRAAAPPTP